MEHSTIYSLISLRKPAALHPYLTSGDAKVRKAVLIAMDQMGAPNSAKLILHPCSVRLRPSFGPQRCGSSRITPNGRKWCCSTLKRSTAQDGRYRCRTRGSQGRAPRVC